MLNAQSGVDHLCPLYKHGEQPSYGPSIAFVGLLAANAGGGLLLCRPFFVGATVEA